ncbi:transcriptional regulator [Wolbachia pipientis]|uniref:Transcriptional regulator n=1 Tax=Wolbachia pipientis TaxID=955 RepID=A0A1E7QJB2_WOLPI|nr:heme exporter protein CcmB [Wolbachia pipientis]OEY86571.1 transcriptional regulator [Wolbachia pipientis]
MFYKTKIIATGYVHIISLFIIMLILVSFSLENYNNNEIILALVWTCATFILQVSTSKLFVSEYNDGTLEQIFIQPISSRLTVAYTIFTHWLIFGLSLSIISAIFSLAIFSNSTKYAITIGLSLLFNTSVIVSISATGNALTLGKNDLASVVSQVLVLPLLMPAFIYFKLLIDHEITIHIILVTILIFIISIANSIIATHAALKLAVEQD